MQYPPTAQLLKRFSIEGFGGDITKFADINGDGRPELLIMQSAGQFCTRLAQGREDVDEVDRTLYCLTAVTLDGEVLWQDGTPYNREFPFTSHGTQGGQIMLGVDDVDADGHAEVIVIRHGELVLLDGATGQFKASVALPLDNITNLYTAQLGAPENGKQIICKVNDAAYKPWEYANPTMIFNGDLSVHREPFAIPGAGHNVIVRDVDGDGRDEIFIGYSLLDHDGSVIWSLDFGPDFNYAREHADHIDVFEPNGDGQLEIHYAGSKDFLAVDGQGKVIWQTSAGHSQKSGVGNWGPNGERRIILCEKNDGLWGLDASGQILWRETKANGYVVDDVRWASANANTSAHKQWALFRPQLKLIRPTPYYSDPAWSRELWPRFLDGDGKFHEVFPWDESYAQPKQLIRAERSYDCGVKYYPLVCDINGDGLDEVLIHDRHQVWIFQSPPAAK